MTLDEDDVHLWGESYLSIYLFVCALGNKDFRYELTDKAAELDIGGYGLLE